jgi:hypothetical protein
MTAPDPDDYTAEWVQSGGGSRQASRNLNDDHCFQLLIRLLRRRR